jgi:hypothetical protein
MSLMAMAIHGLYALAQPASTMRPSGFWTSPLPATHGSYRYRMLGIGVALVLLMGIIVARAIKKANASRR